MLPFSDLSLYYYKNQIKDNKALSDGFRSFNTSVLEDVKNYIPSTYNMSVVLNDDKLGTVDKVKTIVKNEVEQFQSDMSNGLEVIFQKSFDVLGWILKMSLNNPYIIGFGIVLLYVVLKK